VNVDAPKFWESKTLDAMDADQWESLCDGCGRCCLIKLEDEDDGEVAVTGVACRLLNTRSCRCRHYARRRQHVPDCIALTPADVATLGWLPSTCAYRLIHEGKPLFPWHPLISGSPDSVHQAGISVRGRVLSETQVHPDNLVDYIVHWVD
jgi:uncharacterized cysteine cluster protein YcgN (CxxCxxCC family)